jgi:hypothetical protein
VGIFDSDRAPLHSLDAIGPIAELEYVAGHALDGEVFVDAPDYNVLRFEEDLIVCGIGNRAA